MAADKTLARIHHPDLGGDSAAMPRINDASATGTARVLIEFGMIQRFGCNCG